MTIRPQKPDPARAEAAERIKAWTRARFSLDAGATIAVAEIACGLPGCPPLETVVTFWTAPDRRHAFKVFKRTVEVAEDDLPPAFMKTALAAEENALLCC